MCAGGVGSSREQAGSDPDSPGSVEQTRRYKSQSPTVLLLHPAHTLPHDGHGATQMCANTLNNSNASSRTSCDQLCHCRAAQCQDTQHKTTE
uniref:Uncharacterized protein n=1 Tax=Knipowitschia caucasica TaxID=637954 RepID=A0AAV2JIM4_KNICA